MGSKTKFSLEDLIKDVKVQSKTAMEEGSDSTAKKEDKKEEKKEDKKEDKKEMKKEDKKEEKKQEASSPVDDAIKMAEKLASLEKEAALKEMMLNGKAFMEGVMSSYNSYENMHRQKTAQHRPVRRQLPNDPRIKMAFEQGYRQKLAQELTRDPEAVRSFINGHEKTASMIIKVGKEMQYRGFTDAARVISNIALSNK